MQLHNEFEVPASVDVVWAYLLNVEQIAPCMPGAELTEVVDDRTWKGKVTVKVGPVSMAFAGTVVIEERDDDAKRVVLKADGRDQRGKGAANAKVTAQLTSSGSGAKVTIDTDLTITGAAAQYARGGMIQDISSRLTGQFAECLASNLTASDAPPPVAGASEAPVAGAATGATPAPSAAPDSGTPSARAAAPAPSAAPDSGTPSARPPAPGSGMPSASPPPPSPAPPSPAPARPAPQAAKPVGGGRLALWALWRAVVRFFKGLFGGGRSRS
jgi:uncharacterized protein